MPKVVIYGFVFHCFGHWIRTCDLCLSWTIYLHIWLFCFSWSSKLCNIRRSLCNCKIAGLVIDLWLKHIFYPFSFQNFYRLFLYSIFHLYRTCNCITFVSAWMSNLQYIGTIDPQILYFYWTGRYVAPEVFLNEEYDTKVDVFSFALILQEVKVHTFVLMISWLGIVLFIEFFVTLQQSKWIHITPVRWYEIVNWF